MNQEQQQAPIQATKLDHLLFVIITLMYWFSLYIYVPVFSPYLDYLGASYVLAGIILGSYGFMQIIIRLPLGILSDKLQLRRPFIALGLLTGALSCIGFALTEQLGWTLVFRALSGITASTWVAFTVLYSSYFTKKEIPKAMGIITFVTIAGQLVAMGLSGYMTSLGGWHAPFWLGGIVGIIGLVLCIWIKESKEGVARTPIKLSELAGVMKEPLLLKASILSIMAHSILFITMFGFTPLHAHEIGASTGEISLLVFSFMIPHAIAAILSGKWFVPKIGQWYTIMIGFIISGICTILIPLSSSLWTLNLTQAFNGFAQGLHMPILLGMAIQAVSDNKRATAMGFYQAAYAVGMFAGPFVAGWISTSYGLAGGFYLGGSVGLMATLLVFVWSRQASRLEKQGMDA